MTTDVEIRRALQDDLDTLLQIRMEVLNEGNSLGHSDSRELEEASWQYYNAALADDSHIACFATRGGRIVGCGGMCIHTEMPTGANPSGRCACLTNIYLLHDSRNYDLGRDIVTWLIAQARSRGITKIYLESSVAERYMYHSMGFRGMPDMMILSAAAV